MERAEYYEKTFEFLKKFDKIYYSWQTGNVKPDDKCFTRILKENNLKANQCYYFDDPQKNVEKARELGFKAYKWESITNFKKTINLQEN